MTDELYDPLLSVLEQANMRLSECPTVDDVCRQGVLFALQELGFDRAGILLADEEGQHARGTWGTDHQGQVVEEKDLCLPLAMHPWLQVSIGAKGVLVVRNNAKLTFYEEPVGKGWNAVVSLWDEGSAFGWLSVDNVISGRSLTVVARAQVVMFGALLAQWYKRREAEGQWHDLQATLEQKVAMKTLQLQQSINQLKQAQNEIALQEKAKALSYFTAGVAHEINTPLGYIRSNLFFIGKTTGRLVERLRSLSQPNLDAECVLLQGFDEVIAESVSGLDRVSEIVNLLQPLNKLVDEQAQLVDLVAAIDFLIASIESKHTIRFIQPSDVFHIYVPLQVLTLALESLLNNAIYAVRDNDNGCVQVFLYRSESHVSINVLDNGEGIPEENLSNIFQPFYSTKPVGSGVGLGLSISENLLRLINGRLRIRSIEGWYTQATIEFPIEVMHYD